jgi:hypothetical protein
VILARIRAKAAKNKAKTKAAAAAAASASGAAVMVPAKRSHHAHPPSKLQRTIAADHRNAIAEQAMARKKAMRYQSRGFCVTFENELALLLS